MSRRTTRTVWRSQSGSRSYANRILPENTLSASSFLCITRPQVVWRRNIAVSSARIAASVVMPCWLLLSTRLRLWNPARNSSCTVFGTNRMTLPHLSVIRYRWLRRQRRSANSAFSRSRSAVSASISGGGMVRQSRPRAVDLFQYARHGGQAVLHRSAALARHRHLAPELIGGLFLHQVLAGVDPHLGAADRLLGAAESRARWRRSCRPSHRSCGNIPGSRAPYRA